MENPKIKTKVIHSESKLAYNVVGVTLGKKYKIARVPYFESSDEVISKREKEEAFNLAEFISFCFNNSDQILNNQ